MVSKRKTSGSEARERQAAPRPDRELYERLWLVREFDERVSILHRQGKIVGGAYSGLGQEAIQVGVCQVMQEGDAIFPIHRDMGVFLLRGIDPGRLMAQFLARRDGLSGGRDSFLHTGDPERGVVGATSMLGATLPVAAGVALAMKLRRQPNLAIALFGEGATSRGDFHEALNFAGVHNLPVLFVCENNLYAYSTPMRLQMPVDSVAARAEAYGMRGVRCNGNDLLRVLSTVEEAAQRARAGEGPTLIECVTYRIHGHSEHDPARYRSEEEWTEWAGRDPIELFELYLAKRGHDVPKLREEVRAKVREIADRAIEFGEASPFPDGPEALEGIWCPDGPDAGTLPHPATRPAGAATGRPGSDGSGAPDGGHAGAGGEGARLPVRSLIPDGTMPGTAAEPGGEPRSAAPAGESTYIDAIRQALDEEMERDPSVILLGEDIGRLGGAFGATKGLIEKYGEERVIDTPISESLIIGAAVGASIAGMRPVAEMQFADFISCGFDQIVNTAATLAYRHPGMLGARIVIRAPAGARIHGGLFHSQNPESFFLSTPGIKIVAPSSAADAKGLLKSAIRDNNPVLFLEYKYLYRRVKEMLGAADEEVVPIGRAARVASGSDLTILAYGPAVPLCKEAAETLGKDGIGVDLLDLRTLKPLDMDAIRASLETTGRLMIVHEDRRFCGLGAEIAARVAEEMFEMLDAPVARVTTLDAPYAYSPPMEEFLLPDAKKVIEAAHRLLAY